MGSAEVEQPALVAVGAFPFSPMGKGSSGNLLVKETRCGPPHEDPATLVPPDGESSLLGGNIKKLAIYGAETGGPESSPIVGNSSAVHSGTRSVGWLRSLL